MSMAMLNDARRLYPEAETKAGKSNSVLQDHSVRLRDTMSQDDRQQDRWSEAYRPRPEDDAAVRYTEMPWRR